MRTYVDQHKQWLLLLILKVFYQITCKNNLKPIPQKYTSRLVSLYFFQACKSVYVFILLISISLSVYDFTDYLITCVVILYLFMHYHGS